MEPVFAVTNPFTADTALPALCCVLGLINLQPGFRPAFPGGDKLNAIAFNLGKHSADSGNQLSIHTLHILWGFPWTE
jgi:hypothetical protein